MFFTYPTQAIQDNWIHECIQYALTRICEALDANQDIPTWPEVIPVIYRESLRRRKSLPSLLEAFATSARALSNADREIFLQGFFRQNDISNLLDGTIEPPLFNKSLEATLSAAGAVCNEGFNLLGKLDARERHYKIIYDQIKSKTCPFCGTEPFDAPGLASEDEDHYLARSIYPLASANLANLVPMGSKCNQRYKGRVDILHDGGVRRKALNPYGTVEASISLVNSMPLAGDAGRPEWSIEMSPDTEEIHTWERVFAIRERLINNVLDPYFDTWISELPDWFSFLNLDEDSDDASLVSALDQFVCYKAKHREQGAGFFKDKVFEFLAYHYRNGSGAVIAMLRSCLPKSHAA